MPIYEYVCRSCETRFERMRPMAERLSAPSCDACGSGRTALALSVPGHVGVAADAAPGPCGRTDPACCRGACQA